MLPSYSSSFLFFLIRMSPEWTKIFAHNRLTEHENKFVESCIMTKKKRNKTDKNIVLVYELSSLHNVFILFFFLHRNLNTKADSYALTEHTSVLRHYLHFNVVHTMREKCFPSLFFLSFSIVSPQTTDNYRSMTIAKIWTTTTDASFTWFANNLCGKKTRNHFNQSVSMFWELSASKLMFSNESTWKFNGNIFTKIPFIGSIQSSQNRT